MQKPTAKNIELRYGSLQAFFEELEADIICVQETKLMADAIPHSLKNVPGYESFWTCSSAKKGYSGVATYVKLSRAAIRAYDDSCLLGVLLISVLQKRKMFETTERAPECKVQEYWLPDRGLECRRERDSAGRKVDHHRPW